jgi:hypothetical protein
MNEASLSCFNLKLDYNTVVAFLRLRLREGKMMPAPASTPTFYLHCAKFKKVPQNFDAAPAPEKNDATPVLTWQRMGEVGAAAGHRTLRSYRPKRNIES